MHVDTTNILVWNTEDGDGDYLYRKMNDKVNIWGVFLDFGYRYYFYHCFFDLNCGIGTMWVNHKMMVAGERLGSRDITDQNHPFSDALHQESLTVNFTLTIGGAF